MSDSRVRIGSGSRWEAQVGYSRVVRVGRRVWVAGTTASDEQGQALHPGDAYQQTRVILQRIGAALEQAGASLSDMVRTRIFVTDISDWQAVGRAHGEVFGDTRPAATMVEVARLIDPGLCVEIEADAVVDGD